MAISSNFSINGIKHTVNPYIYFADSEMLILANSGDLDEMQQNTAFHQLLHCLQR